MTGFRLAVVERLREQRLRVCAQDLNTATAALTQAEAIRRGLQSQLSHGSPPGPTSPDQLARGAIYRDRLRGDLLEQAEVITRLITELAERRGIWIAAHAQYRAITALHEHHRLARRELIAHQEQLELDELAGARRRTARPGPDPDPGPDLRVETGSDVEVRA